MFSLGTALYRFQTLGLRETLRDLSTFERSISRISFTSLRMFGIAGGIGALFGGLGLGTAVSHSIQLAANAESAETSFRLLLGSAEQAKIALNELKQFAAQTPLEFPEIRGASNQLLAAKVQAKDLVPVMRMLGDVGVPLGVSLQRMTYLYSTMKSQNRVMNQDLMQFATSGIPIFEYLSRVLGVPIPKIRELASEGKIAFKDIHNALALMVKPGERFNNQMAELSKTLGGKWSTLKDALNIGVFEKLGVLLVDKLDIKGWLDKAIDAANRFEQVFGPAVAGTLDYVVAVAKESWKFLGPGFRALGIEFSGSGSTIKKAIEFVGNSIIWLSRVAGPHIPTIVKAITTITATVVGLHALALGFTVAKFALSPLLSLLGLLPLALSAVAGLTATVFSPVGLAITAIVAAAGAGLFALYAYMNNDWHGTKFFEMARALAVNWDISLQILYKTTVTVLTNIGNFFSVTFHNIWVEVKFAFENIFMYLEDFGNRTAIIVKGATNQWMMLIKTMSLLMKGDFAGAAANDRLMATQQLQRLGDATTTLDDKEEARYQAWMKRIGHTKEKGFDVDAQGTGTNYDYRGYFKKFGDAMIGAGQHLTDEFKLPNHPTFSDESRYATGKNRAKAGHWEGDTYIPPSGMGQKREYEPKSIAEETAELWEELARRMLGFDKDEGPKLTIPEFKTPDFPKLSTSQYPGFMTGANAAAEEEKKRRGRGQYAELVGVSQLAEKMQTEALNRDTNAHIANNTLRTAEELAALNKNLTGDGVKVKRGMGGKNPFGKGAQFVARGLTTSTEGV